MYKGFIRPLLFLIDPEKVHHLVVFFVRLLSGVPGLNNLIKKALFIKHKSLKTTVAGLHFNNKVGLAAGFDKNAEFFDEFAAFGFSFIEIGTVTPLPQPGNPKPRLFRLPEDKALINRMGFNNKGADYAAAKLRKRRTNIIIGGNIGKNTATPNEKAPQDYLTVFKTLYDQVDYFTVNVSCPNIKDLDKLQDSDSLADILGPLVKFRSEQAIRRPVFLKISPDISFRQLDETLEVYSRMGLDGIIATNTTTDRKCLSYDADFIVKTGAGGLSGLPLKQRALDIVRYICKQSEGRIPVIGVGGIMTAEDAVDMIKAGAVLVQVYTGFIYEGPLIVKRCNQAIAEYLSSRIEQPEVHYVS
ncbi:MAG TPA: quinone-dependent dihydroorotate dehydrogenase [Bacteroidales bacterium]|nr:quinone-dependent dihydroorotate dehydrogenase [Bacteroidales bacterium]